MGSAPITSGRRVDSILSKRDADNPTGNPEKPETRGRGVPVANSLLDFVMSVVRDPDTAARYAADPAQAIADADLGDVTSADVDNLIPVVAESLSAAVPSAGADTAANVWASGAATAAFDAFGAIGSTPSGETTHDTQPSADAPSIIDDGLHAIPGTDSGVSSGAAASLDADSVAGIIDPVIDDSLPEPTGGAADAFGAPLIDDQPGEDPQDPGFDVFT